MGILMFLMRERDRKRCLEGMIGEGQGKRRRNYIFLGWFFLLLLFLSLSFPFFLCVLFFLLLKRKRWQNLYYFIALCVIFIELVGTFFGCWKWVPKIFGTISAVNPPMGAVFFYAGGDVLLAKIVAVWENKKLKTIL